MKLSAFHTFWGVAIIAGCPYLQACLPQGDHSSSHSTKVSDEETFRSRVADLRRAQMAVNDFLKPPANPNADFSTVRGFLPIFTPVTGLPRPLTLIEVVAELQLELLENDDCGSQTTLQLAEVYRTLGENAAMGEMNAFERDKFSLFLVFLFSLDPQESPSPIDDEIYRRIRRSLRTAYIASKLFADIPFDLIEKDKARYESLVGIVEAKIDFRFENWTELLSQKAFDKVLALLTSIQSGVGAASNPNLTRGLPSQCVSYWGGVHKALDNRTGRREVENILINRNDPDEGNNIAEFANTLRTSADLLLRSRLEVQGDKFLVDYDILLKQLGKLIRAIRMTERDKSIQEFLFYLDNTNLDTKGFSDAILASNVNKTGSQACVIDVLERIVDELQKVAFNEILRAEAE